MAVQEVAIRKRQQIAKANKMMFLWVAAISALVGIAAVVSLFLTQKLIFNEKVLAEKTKTASTLQKNNKVVDELKSQIRVLNTNQALIDTRAKADDEPVQVILDALPSDANSAALGASLQEKLIAGDGITIDTFTMNVVQGVETTSDDTASTANSDVTTDGENQIGFRVAVSSTDVNALKLMLQRLERSIRAIDVTSMSLETQNNRYLLTLEGHGYYEPAKTVELKNKVVKP